MNRRVSKAALAIGVGAIAGLCLYLLLRHSDGRETERAQGPVAAPVSDLPYQPLDTGGRSPLRPLPRKCEPTRVATTVLEFLEAFNHGDRRVLRFIAPLPKLQDWGVAVRNGRSVRAKSPAEILAYMRQRHQQGERQGRLEIAVNQALPSIPGRPTSGPAGKEHLAAFDFKLSRTASDLRAVGIRTQLGGGKGGINCRTNRIFLWSSNWGLTQSDVVTCPKATTEPSWSSAVACAPGYRRVNEAVEVRLSGQPAS